MKKSKKMFILVAGVCTVNLGMMPTAEASLQLPAPITVNAGPMGKIGIQGVVSGMAFWQDNPQEGNGGLAAKHVGTDITNGMVIIQKNTGLLQFTIEAGAYSFPTLASGFTSASSTINEYYGALPVAYLTIAPDNNLSIDIGKIPSLIGAEDGFTYQNFNIERGLLWNVEPTISRGVQVNYSQGPLSASLSWNDGYYSNRYNNISGDLTWTINNTNTLEFYGSSNLGRASHFEQESSPSSEADDSSIYGLIYTYSRGPWTIEPYFQYMTTYKQPGTLQSFANYGGALLAGYSFTHKISLEGRVEYLNVTGIPGEGAATVTDLPGGSHAWSFTVTPTYQDGDYFLRGELSYVTASCPQGSGFTGFSGTNTNQLRGLVETGFLF